MNSIGPMPGLTSTAGDGPIRCGGGARSATTKVALGEWAVCLPAAHPGYLSWEAFMANQQRLADNTNRYAAGHAGVPRQGSALLQGIAVCRRCGRRMSLRYTGPKGDYPVYCCRADRDRKAGPLCQEVRPLAIDAFVQRTFLDALAPDQIAIAVAALGQLQQEAERLEKQWAVRRERALYDAERARRQYDAVEPENRLVARSLERAWEEKLRAVEAIEQEYERWRRAEPLVLSDEDRAGLQILGENLPQLWQAATNTAGERKQLLRFIVREVVLDQKRAPGHVWLRIVWQTGATSEHRVQRRVHTYRDYRDLEQLRQRVAALNGTGMMDKEIATALNREGFVAARGCTFNGENVWLLRKRWGTGSGKIHGG